MKLVKSPLAWCSREFKKELLCRVNSYIVTARRMGIVGLYPLSMRDLHIHVSLTFVFLCTLIGLFFTGLLLHFVLYATVYAVFYRLAQ